jgi:ribosomal protein S18 acetylase RimI-like enzyme
VIIPLSVKHSQEVACLHVEHLRSPLGGLTGRRLLQSYYTAVALEQGAYGYVAEQEGRVLGYVCGVWDPAQVRATLLKHLWGPLLFWGVGQVIQKPRLLLSFFNRARTPAPSPGTSDTGYELRPIVVSPAARGTDLAAHLVKALLLDAQRRGYPGIHLFTEHDNIAANRFYQKAGFQAGGTVDRGETTYIRYELSVSEVV